MNEGQPLRKVIQEESNPEACKAPVKRQYGGQFDDMHDSLFTMVRNRTKLFDVKECQQTEITLIRNDVD